MEQGEREKFLVTLAHDEFIEGVIAGHNEDYQSWTKFIGECILKMRVPEQRNGQ
jgi:hypothetical protein